MNTTRLPGAGYSTRCFAGYQNRTIGEYLRQELSEPIGLEESELERRSAVSIPKPSRWLIESLKPKFLNRRIERNLLQMLGLGFGFVRSARDSSRPTRQAFAGQEGMIDAFNSREVAMGETP